MGDFIFKQANEFTIVENKSGRAFLAPVRHPTCPGQDAGALLCPSVILNAPTSFTKACETEEKLGIIVDWKVVHRNSKRQRKAWSGNV
jgi:hypothetical protein